MRPDFCRHPSVHVRGPSTSSSEGICLNLPAPTEKATSNISNINESHCFWSFLEIRKPGKGMTSEDFCRGGAASSSAQEGLHTSSDHGLLHLEQ